MSTHHIAVISDTHGLLRPEVVSALQGVDRIIHAGDVGTAGILDALRAIAPLTVVRGNVDYGPHLITLPETQVLTIDETSIYILHNLDELDLDPAAAGFQMVIYGHTHQPAFEHRAEVMYLNPGSVGPRRFHLPVTYARLTVTSGEIQAQIIELKV